MKTRAQLKLLLVQIRDKPQVREEEFDSFVRFAGINSDQLSVLNVFDQPRFSPQLVDNFDAVLVGGASEASVLEPEVYPFVPDCVQLLQYCKENAKPVFASCFGFQLAVLAMGGEIVRDTADFEIGTLPIQITEAGYQDPLFSGFPNPFYAVSVHRERAPQLPSNCELLAYTEQCPHAFKVHQRPFWAFQFHPEVDKDILIERLSVFRAQYTQNAEHFNQVISHAKDTPWSNLLVERFVDTLVLPPENNKTNW
ncbi:type 1 glutamine amidotransferase [Planctobacterium marinum]|uniref:type 1 glutamine amidotransferase n=1 Tax=Planctobacterium marinum TaxID=1631968 RepID=UPI001E539AA9|nr:type 1 glutamine amidotransferase [Planctobacterium marinum]